MHALLDQGLFTAFDVYLIAVTGLTAVARLGLIRRVFRTLRQYGRWPRVGRLLAGHVEILLGPRMLAPVLAYACVFMINAVARTFLFPEVDLSLADLAANPLLVVPIAPIGALMVTRDLSALRSTTEFDDRRAERALDLAEAVLVAVEHGDRLLPERRRGALHARIVKPLSRAGIEVSFVPDANRWLGQLAVQTGIKLLFGACVWMTWALFLAG